MSILSLSSCSKPLGWDYFPLSNGAQADYSVEFAAPFVGVQKGKARERVDGRENIRGSDYYKVVSVTTGIPGAESQTNYFRKTEKGIYEIEGKHKDSPEFLAFPFPLVVGSEWTVSEAEGKYECRVESEESAEMWGKTYEHALKMTCHGQYKGKAIEMSEYLAKGVGAVKIVSRYSGVTIEFTLEGYKH